MTTATTTPAVLQPEVAARSRGRSLHMVRAVLTSARGATATGYLVLLLLAGIFAGTLAPRPPGAQDLSAVLSGPSGANLLGTDALGRDVLSRLLYGILPSLQNSLIALAVFVAIGVPIGLMAGYRGGMLDTAVTRIVDLMLAMPPIILILVVLAVFSSSPTAAMIALGVLAAPGLVRVTRGATLAAREELFVTAAKIAGASPARIILTHILRQVLGPILAQASVFAGVSLAVQAALAFLGLLSSSSHPTWGGMIGDASQVITQDIWLLFPPGAVLGLTVLALGVLGDVIRDVTAAPAAAAPRKSAKSTPTRSRAATTDDRTSSSSDADALLVLRGLQISAGPTVLVDDATLTVRAGETVAVVGESGCGKSITALAALGLLPSGVSVTNGQVLLDGVDLTAGGAKAYRAVRGRAIAYVAQDALGSLDPTYSVGSHLMEVIGLHERSGKRAARARAVELLQQVHIPDPERVLRAYPHEISGGMAQRVNIAIALSGRPRLLIADEPTTALDVTVQAEILRLLRELRATTDMAILLITHDWGVVADIADRAVVMYAGEVVETAAAAALFDTPRFPYTAALLAADPSLADEGARLPTVPGRVPPPGSWPNGCRFADRCAYATDSCTAGPIPLSPDTGGSRTRCIRVDELVQNGALPR